MALAKYTPACAKNTAGIRPQLYLIEANLITSVTEDSNEISAVTMSASNKFHRVNADFDSVQFTSEGTFGTSGASEQKLIFRLSKPTTAMHIFINSLKEAVTCGAIAIYVDANAQAWAFGISAAAKEGKSRPINKLETSFDSGVMPNDENAQAFTITLSRMGWYDPVPFDTANNTTILAGTAAFITWD